MEDPMRILFITYMLFLLSYSGNSTTLKVPDDYLTIQAAMDAAVAFDIILVAPGTYVENIDFKGKAVSLKSSDGPEHTVIDGGDPANPDLGSVVLFNKGEGSDSLLEGFTLTNGLGFWMGSFACGGGIYCDSSSPTITENVIMNNSALYGGGIFCSFQSPTIERNTIYNHEVEDGGGIYCSAKTNAIILQNLIFNNYSTRCGGGIFVGANALPVLRENFVFENRADWSGGGINGYQCSPIVERNVFYGNVAGKRGGGVRFGFPFVTITNNFIYNNHARYGGGMSCGSSLITNNTLCGNYATGYGGGISVSHLATVTVANTILWDNNAPIGPEIHLSGTLGPSTLSISYSDLEGGETSVHLEEGCTLDWGLGMIDADPLFVDPADSDYHLYYNSPCRNSGNNAAPGLPDVDFENDPRIAYETADMGSDEFYPHLYHKGDATPGSTIQIKFTGIPQTSPVGFWIGFDLYDPPLKCLWGDWYLKLPVIGPIVLEPIPENGVEVFPGPIPSSVPGPYSFFLQALIGDQMTNFWKVDV